jgi:hypothetical protein
MDAGRAESLKTVASFLVDVELMRYALLEITTGGFTLHPLDPAVEFDPADIEALYQRYTEIATQKDSFMEALSQIESRASVSLGTLYVRSQWAPPLGDFDATNERAANLFLLLGMIEGMRDAARAMEGAQQSPEEAIESAKSALAVGSVLVTNECWYFRTDASTVWELYKTPEVLKMHKAWQEYAEKLAEELSGDADEGAAGDIRKDLEEKIRNDLQTWAPNAPSEAIDAYAGYFVDEVAKVVSALAGTPAPTAEHTATSAMPTPKASPTAILTATPAFTAALTRTPPPAETVVRIQFDTESKAATSEGAA